MALQPSDVGFPTSPRCARGDRQCIGITTLMLSRFLASFSVRRRAWGWPEIIPKSMLRGRGGLMGKTIYWFVLMKFSRPRLHINLGLITEE